MTAISPGIVLLPRSKVGVFIEWCMPSPRVGFTQPPLHCGGLSPLGFLVSLSRIKNQQKNPPYPGSFVSRSVILF